MTVLALPDIAAAVAAKVERASRGDAFVGVRLDPEFDPTDLLASPRANGVVASYERPSKGFALVAVGVAGRADAAPGEGPRSAREGSIGLLDHALETDDERLIPRVLGGFAFRDSPPPSEPWTDFGSGSLVLPRLLFVRDGDLSGVVVAPRVDADEVRSLLERAAGSTTSEVAPPLRRVRPVDGDRYRAGVRAIARDIRAGAYEKAVLATTQQLALEGETSEIDVGQTLARLRVNYPECHLFTVSADGATFLGASPELLVGLSGGTVSTLGLAGSARRGETDEDDERIGRALLASAKDRQEHETVVRAIREALADVTERLRIPAEPGVRRLRNIQHLATDISGRVVRGVDILELVQRLHPTPAVCGWPQVAAQHVIAVLESFDRGWYAGPVGWMDASGNGEFAVGLRAALVRGGRAWLFAGNGIMGDSDPDAELAEVQLKFRPLADALAGTAL